MTKVWRYVTNLLQVVAMALQIVVFFVGAISQYGRSRAMYPDANVEDSSIGESVGELIVASSSGDTVANATGSIYGLVFKGTFQAAELPWDSFADFVGYLIPASAGELFSTSCTSRACSVCSYLAVI